MAHGADSNIQNHLGLTPLMTVLAKKYTDNYMTLVKLLIQRGADVNIESYRDNRTPLHLAVISKKQEAVVYLLQQDIDLDHRDSTGKTPLTNAITYHVHKTNSCNLESDVFAMIKLLTDAGSNLNMSDTEYCNPLMMSIMFKCHTLVRYFLERGANVNIQVSFSNIYPLLLAVKLKDIQTIRVLLEWNCNFNLKGLFNFKNEVAMLTPFEIACYQQSENILSLLIAHGYNVSELWFSPRNDVKDRTDIDGNTKTIVDMLMQHATTPRHLTDMCYLVVFNCLQQNKRQKIYLLPLPKKIKETMITTLF